MNILVKWMNRLTSLAYWLMVAIVPLLIAFAIVRVISGSMNRQSGAQFMLIAGTLIGALMFLFLILKIITSLIEESIKSKEEPETPSDT